MIPSRSTRAVILAAAAVAVGEPTLAQGTADEMFADRIEALELDARCELFSGEVGTALEAGAMLGRNALLRSAWSEAQVAAFAQRIAAGTDALTCDGAEAASVVAQVENGYAGWRQLRDMSFPADQRTWTARRSDAGESWLLVQNVTGADGARAVFGLARREDGEIRPALALRRAQRPRAARLLVRDTALAPRRVESELMRLAAREDPHPLAAAAAPDVFTRAIWAGERSQHEADSPYADGFDGDVALLWFPASAIVTLAELDPREAVAIELDLASRDIEGSFGRYYVEVGDFTPAAMFVGAPPQPSSAAPSEGSANPASRTR